MDVIAYLIPIALFMGLLGLAAFIWAMKSGQWEDLDGAAMRILHDDAHSCQRNRRARRLHPSLAQSRH